MLRFICVTFIATLQFVSLQYTYANSSNKIDTVKSISLDAAYYNKRYTLTKRDLTLANHIQSVFEMARRQSLNARIIKQTLSEAKKNKNFSTYTLWLEGLDKIQSLSGSPKKLVQFCSMNFNTSYAELDKQLHHLCDKYIFETVSGPMVKNKSDFNLITNYMSARIDQDASNFDDLLSGLLTRSQSNEQVYERLSNIIIDKIINQKLPASSKLISSLKVNNNLTLYLQRYGLSQYSTESIFLTQLKEMKSVIYSSFDQGVADAQELSNLVDNILNFTHYNSSYLPASRTAQELNSLAKFISRREEYKVSRKITEFIIDKHGPIYDDLVFSYLWTFIEAEKYSNAVDFINSSKLLNYKEKFDSKLKFWVAYCFEKSGNTEQSDSFYQEIINENPLSYYSIMSAKHLVKKSPETKTPDLIFKNRIGGIKESSEFLANETTAAIRRMKAFSQINASPLIDIENSHNIHRLSGDKETLGSVIKLTTTILNDDKNFIDSFGIIYSSLDRKVIDFDQDIAGILFPTPYYGKVKSNVNEIDPLVVMSLIRQESGFNPKAKSRVGALGLMQLMPSTAKQMKKNVKKYQLTHPEINIKLGSKYFSYLFKKYDENLVYALSAYNAGENRVKRWKDMFFRNNSMLHTIEAIPFKETRKYVQLIFRNIYFYKIVTNESVDQKDPHFPNRIYDVSLGFTH